MCFSSYASKKYIAILGLHIKLLSHGFSSLSTNKYFTMLEFYTKFISLGSSILWINKYFTVLRFYTKFLVMAIQVYESINILQWEISLTKYGWLYDINRYFTWKMLTNIIFYGIKIPNMDKLTEGLTSNTFFIVIVNFYDKITGRLITKNSGGCFSLP